MDDALASKRQATSASNVVEALALAVSYALFDRLVAEPFKALTYNVSDAMPSWLAAMFVALPQGIAAGLLGWFAARQRIGNVRGLLAIGLLLLAVRVGLHWQETVFAVSDVVMPTLLFESLVVPLAFAMVAIVTRRRDRIGDDHHFKLALWAAPAVPLAAILATLALALIFVIQPLQWLMLLLLNKAPVEAAPLIMCVVPFALFFAAAYFIAGRRWLSWEGCFTAWVFVVTCHISQWALGGNFADHWLARALMVAPVLATATGCILGYVRATSSARINRHADS